MRALSSKDVCRRMYCLTLTWHEWGHCLQRMFGEGCSVLPWHGMSEGIVFKGCVAKDVVSYLDMAWVRALSSKDVWWRMKCLTLTWHEWGHCLQRMCGEGWSVLPWHGVSEGIVFKGCVAKNEVSYLDMAWVRALSSKDVWWRMKCLTLTWREWGHCLQRMCGEG